MNFRISCSVKAFVDDDNELISDNVLFVCLPVCSIYTSIHNNIRSNAKYIEKKNRNQKQRRKEKNKMMNHFLYDKTVHSLKTNIKWCVRWNRIIAIISIETKWKKRKKPKYIVRKKREMLNSFTWMKLRNRWSTLLKQLLLETTNRSRTVHSPRYS